ncbi:SRPBCC family protein [Paenibacillus sp. 2TAB23]|uniref:SRPBCC family protein n=1 Tax=Paenibacillus sp. 2TAB23 TaxID=3233004 RepID=UPI003F9DB9A6
MLATIKQAADGYEVRFERDFKHSPESVWAWLTENDKLVQWFSELRVQDLREGGVITFDMQDGTFEELAILEFKEQEVLAFAWDKDQVRFELIPEFDGCRLVLVEKLITITAHTPRDIAGWDVCLDVIQSLMDGSAAINRKASWQTKYEQYVQAFAEITKKQHGNP